VRTQLFKVLQVTYLFSQQIENANMYTNSLEINYFSIKLEDRSVLNKPIRIVFNNIQAVIAEDERNP
jgi:hypothetical protein